MKKGGLPEVTPDPCIFSFGDRMTKMEAGKVIRVMKGDDMQAHAGASVDRS